MCVCVWVRRLICYPNGKCKHVFQRADASTHGQTDGWANNILLAQSPALGAMSYKFVRRSSSSRRINTSRQKQLKQLASCSARSSDNQEMRTGWFPTPKTTASWIDNEIMATKFGQNSNKVMSLHTHCLITIAFIPNVWGVGVLFVTAQFLCRGRQSIVFS